MKKELESNYLNLFDFGYNENGEYISISEENAKKRNTHENRYSYEDLIKGHETDNDYCIMAYIFLGWGSQYGYEFDELQKEIDRLAETKCYHYGNMEKDIYAYTFKVDKDLYWFCIENKEHIAVIRHIKNQNDLLMGKEKIDYPACMVYIYEKCENGTLQELKIYGEKDIRQIVLCDEFKICEFSTNRIEKGKKPKIFCEAEFELNDFIKYWGETDED